jgi:predicted amidohydrolase
MQDLTISLVQANQIWENKAANLANYERLLQHVDADIIVLPEMFQTGFSMNTAELAEQWSDSPSLSWLRAMASKKSAAIYTSLMIIEDEHHYNRGVFVLPSGEVYKYDKRKTFSLASENIHFSSGKEPTIVEYLDWKFQLQICYDLRFPEIMRNHIQPNQLPAYDVLLFVANWPEKRISHWNALLKARAIENQCFVVGVNRVGEDAKGLSYSGASQLINALGEEMNRSEHEEIVISLILNKKELIETQKTLPFLKDC